MEEEKKKEFKRNENEARKGSQHGGYLLSKDISEAMVPGIDHESGIRKGYQYDGNLFERRRRGVPNYQATTN